MQAVQFRSQCLPNVSDPDRAASMAVTFWGHTGRDMAQIHTGRVG